MAKSEYELRTIAQSHSDPDVREAAVRRVDDEYTLRHIAQHDSHPDVSVAAFLRLNTSSRKELSNFDELTVQVEQSRYINARRNRLNTIIRDFSSHS